MRKKLLVTAVALAALTLTSCGTAEAGSDLNGRKLDKILANTEQIKKKLGIVDPTTPPVTSSTVAPSTSTTTATTVPTTVAGPPPAPGSTAAAKFNWGTALPGSDEFNYTGAPDSAKWGLYDGAGHDGNGKRVAGKNVVGNGYLRQSGDSSGNTGGMASKTDIQGGRWEVRARIAADGSGGHPYHPVLLTWPKSGAWPQGAEYDFFEVDLGDTAPEAFMHYPANTVKQEHFTGPKTDLSQWHNYALDWNMTAKTLTGYIDGVQWFKVTNPSAMAPGPHHGTIQLDNFFGGGMQAAHMDVDWYHIYGGG